MSIAELRRLAFLAGSLGYPHGISVDTFRKPDFVAVSRLLCFFRTLSGEQDVLARAGTPGERVEFILASCTRLQEALGIRLHAEGLYAADQRAARELLKIAHCFTDGLAYAPKGGPEGFRAPAMQMVGNCERLRQNCSGLIESSCALLSALRAGGEVFSSIGVALQQYSKIDPYSLRTTVEGRINTLAEEINAMETSNEVARREKTRLQALLQERLQELNRLQARLEILRVQEAPHEAESRKAEAELLKLFVQYQKRKCSLAFLESQMDAVSRRGDEKRREAAAKLERIQRNVQEEENDNIVKGAEMVVGGGKRKEEGNEGQGSSLEEEYEEEYEEEETEVEETKPPIEKAAPIKQDEKGPAKEAKPESSYSYVYEEEEEEEEKLAPAPPPKVESKPQPAKQEPIPQPRQQEPPKQEEPQEEYSYVYESEEEEELNAGFRPAKPQSIITPAFLRVKGGDLRESTLLEGVNSTALPPKPQKNTLLTTQTAAVPTSPVSQGLDGYSYEYEDGGTPAWKRCLNFDLEALPLEGDASFDV